MYICKSLEIYINPNLSRISLNRSRWLPASTRKERTDIFSRICLRLHHARNTLATPKLQGHPLPRHRPFEIPQCPLGADDLQIDRPYVLLQAGEDVRLGREVFVLQVHLAQFLVRGGGFGVECAAAFEVVE
jgi:hypothetical protein